MEQLRELDPIVVHVEAVLFPTCSLPPSDVEQQVKAFVTDLPNTALSRNSTSWLPTLLKDKLNGTELSKYVQSIIFPDLDSCGNTTNDIELHKVELQIHAYHLTEDDAGMETFSYEEGGVELPSASHWILPSKEFHGLWENLIYDNDVKNQLLNYVTTMLLFSDRQVDNSVISCNRVVLLHGPPGSGKTSLCRALAQKLCIRFRHLYKFGQLIEINSHSLFSKWFSESGKLVMQLFQSIRDIIQDSEALVVILIDEVESLTHARKAAIAGSEPSDAIRVVNAVLTQIDSLRRYPNVLILTTSNITGAIDLAFVDRADIKQYIGLPSVSSIYYILQTCVNELIRKKIVFSDGDILTLKALDVVSYTNCPSITDESLKLYEISKEALGLSGRILRKLPFLAYAIYVKTPVVTLGVFLEALKKAINKEFVDQSQLHK